MDDKDKLVEQLKFYEGKLAEYMPKFLDKKKHFRGVKHEDSLSELRYTEFMVYKNLVEGFQQKIYEIKQKLRQYS